MELKFTKKGDWYEADFTAESDFNLHIEKPHGPLVVYQTTIEGSQYEAVQGLDFGLDNDVVDIDFTAVVFPKYIRVMSKVMPTMAVVTF
jgi:hypothetical protein